MFIIKVGTMYKGEGNYQHAFPVSAKQYKTLGSAKAQANKLKKRWNKEVEIIDLDERPIERISPKCECGKYAVEILRGIPQCLKCFNKR